MALVSLADLAAYLNISNTDPKYTLLQGYLDATVAHVESKVGAVDADAPEWRVRQRQGGALILPGPVESVDALTDPDGNAVDLDACDVDEPAGVIWPTRYASGWWTVEATTAGRGADVALAIKIIASHLWETQRGRVGRPSAYANPGEPVVIPAGFAVPSRAAELLSPYMTGGFA